MVEGLAYNIITDVVIPGLALTGTVASIAYIGHQIDRQFLRPGHYSRKNVIKLMSEGSKEIVYNDDGWGLSQRIKALIPMTETRSQSALDNYEMQVQHRDDERLFLKRLANTEKEI